MVKKNNQEIISYDKNNQEVIVRSKKRKIMGTFSAISKLSLVGDGSQDIFDLLDQVSKGAFRLFKELKSRRNEDTNLVEYPTSDLSKTQKETFSRQLMELRKVDLVRVARRKMSGRELKQKFLTRKNTYMLNPNIIKCWHYEDADVLWGQCKR